MVGSIGVATYSRPELLNQCLSSIIRAKGSRDIPLLVVHQVGNKEVAKIISEWRSHIQLLIEFESIGKSALQNINYNGTLLRTIAFESMGSDWFLGVEEDVVIGGDSIAFIECMMDKYDGKRAFRGVNLGSNLPKQNFYLNCYSRMRFGMQGQASAITKSTWEKFEFKRLVNDSSWNGFDGIVENKIKSGFMCTPLSSRYLDRGWHGTHGFGDPNHVYYRQFERSFVDLAPDSELEYFEVKMQIPLRGDARLYNPITTFYHVIYNYVAYSFHTTLRRLVLKLKNQVKSLSER
jgi:hypothetical protein